MNQEKFFETLDGVYPISSGLRAYLNIALQYVELKKNKALSVEHHQLYPLTFIERGNLKTVLDSKINPDNHLVRIHFQNEILPRFEPQNDQDFDLRIEALQESTLIAIPKKHIYTIYQNFPEFHILIEKIRELHLAQLLHHTFDLQTSEVAERLEKQLSKRPDIFQIAQINDVARFIGTHPNTLSALRSKKP